MSDDPPLLSAMTPLQLFLKTARGLGLGRQALGLVLGQIFAERPGEFAGYEADEHDVFVACFSKSGTNWALQMVLQIIHYGAAEFDHVHDLVPWPEGPFPGIARLDDPGPKNACPTKMRAIKTSKPAHLVPHHPDARYISVLRDPKDVIVSAYYFAMGVFGMSEQFSLQQWFELTAQPSATIGAWARQASSWWARREQPNTLVMLFADMKRDLPGTVDRVAALLGVTLDQAQRATVIERCEFAYMKTRESAFAPMRLPMLTGSGRGTMMRSGKVGGSKEVLDADQRARIDALALELLRELGSDFPYEATFMGK